MRKNVFSRPKPSAASVLESEARIPPAIYVILDKVEVLREQKFSQGQNHNYRKGKLDYRRRFNTQLIITLFSMWWLLKEPFDLIRSYCLP